MYVSPFVSIEYVSVPIAEANLWSTKEPEVCCADAMEAGKERGGRYQSSA